jgi:hypothetical protein
LQARGGNIEGVVNAIHYEIAILVATRLMLKGTVKLTAAT